MLVWRCSDRSGASQLFEVGLSHCRALHYTENKGHAGLRCGCRAGLLSQIGDESADGDDGQSTFNNAFLSFASRGAAAELGSQEIQHVTMSRRLSC